jgi:hypothetical protein
MTLQTAMTEVGRMFVVGHEDANKTSLAGGPFFDVFLS